MPEIFCTATRRPLVKFNTPVISKGAEGSRRSKEEGVARGAKEKKGERRVRGCIK